MTQDPSMDTCPLQKQVCQHTHPQVYAGRNTEPRDSFMAGLERAAVFKGCSNASNALAVDKPKLLVINIIMCEDLMDATLQWRL